jgi:ADP-ribose pyrophosphatase
MTEYQDILANAELTPTLGNAAKGEIEILPTANGVNGLGAENEPAASTGIVYEDKYIKLVRDCVLFPAGSRGTYIRLIISQGRVGGVCIVPTWQGKYVLIRQFRHATRLWHIEFPRGFVEGDASIRDNAARELHEEVGVSSADLQFVGEIFADTGLIASSIGVFVTELVEAPQALGDTGSAELILAGRAEIEEMIGSGAINDAISMAAFVTALHHFEK